MLDTPILKRGDDDESLVLTLDCFFLSSQPMNILLSKNSTVAALTDFGSAAPAIHHIQSHKHAMRLQDRAERFTSMPYRAPELYNVPSSGTLDTKVDIWALGCTLIDA